MTILTIYSITYAWSEISWKLTELALFWLNFHLFTNQIWFLILNFSFFLGGIWPLCFDKKFKFFMNTLTYIKSISKSTQCLSVCLSVLYFNTLPMNQFESQIYLWNSLNMVDILRLFKSDKNWNKKQAFIFEKKKIEKKKSFFF